jgi:hypothetical protein
MAPAIVHTVKNPREGGSSDFLIKSLGEGGGHAFWTKGVHFNCTYRIFIYKFLIRLPSFSWKSSKSASDRFNLNSHNSIFFGKVKQFLYLR